MVLAQYFTQRTVALLIEKRRNRAIGKLSVQLIQVVVHSQLGFVLHGQLITAVRCLRPCRLLGVGVKQFNEVEHAIQASLQRLQGLHQVVPGGKWCLAGNDRGGGVATFSDDLLNGRHQVFGPDG